MKMKIKIKIKIKSTVSSLLAAASLLLAACEAPLVLDKVEVERQKATHRTDAFQASASNRNVINVVASYGVILASKDQGVTWTRTQLENAANLIAITTCGKQTFVALSIEGDIWLSADDGGSWQQKSIATEEAPQALTCDVDNGIWVVGSFGTILHSKDKGTTWASHSLDDDTILTSVQFHTKQLATITGEFGTVLTSEDSGASWQIKEPIPDEFIPLSTYFNDAQHGWVVGLGGVVYYTEDGANTWVKENSGVNVPLFTVTKIGNAIYAVGESGVAIRRGIVADGSSSVSSNDSPNSWQSVVFENSVRSYLRVLQAMGTDKMLIGGAGFVRVVEIKSIQLGAGS